MSLPPPAKPRRRGPLLGALAPVLGVWVLYACGWSTAAPQEGIPAQLLASLELDGAHADGDFLARVRRLLPPLPEALPDSNHKAVIYLQGPRWQRRSGSLDSGARPAEYRLRGLLLVGLRSAALKHPLEEQLVVQQLFPANSDDMHATDSEERLLRLQLEEELAQRAVRAMGRLLKQQATSSTPLTPSHAD